MVLRFAGRAHHVLAILVNHLTNFPRVQSRLRANIGDGAAQTDVVTHEINPSRVLEQTIDVGLPNAKTSIDISTIVRFSTISHVPYSVQNQDLCRTDMDAASQGIGLIAAGWKVEG
jgi:hypothetical protein